MKIVGACRKCGKCCRFHFYALKDGLAETEEVIARSFVNFGVFPIDDYWVLVITPVRCRKLSFDNRCSVHDTKPKMCADYPYNFAPDVFKRMRDSVCGFNVED